MKYLPAALSLSFFALLSHSAYSDTITPEFRRDDPRLSKIVTVELERGNIGDLVKKLASASGVALKADERDGAADPMIVSALHDVPLADALDALWSLVSYKGARWHWSREGAPGKWQYTVRRPVAAQNLPSELRSFVQDAFESEAERVRGYLQMSPKELERRAATDRQAKAILESPRHKAGLQIFFECVPRETQLKILRGQERHYRVDVSAMPAEAQSVITDMWKQANGYRILADGTREPTPAPTHVRFDAGRWPGGDAVPALGMQVEHLGGGHHLGGLWLQDDFADRLYNRWILTGDERSHVREKEQFDPGREEPGSFAPGGPDETLYNRLLAITDLPKVSLIARLPQLPGRSSWDPAREGRAALGEYLDRFGGFPGYLQRKWRGDVLLVTYPAWPRDEETQVPRWLVERLRRAESPQGVLPLSELVFTANVLKREQLRVLARDFPVMNNVASCYGILNLVARKNLLSQIQSESGLPINPGVAQAVTSDEFGGLGKYVLDGSARAVRMSVEMDSTGGMITFGVILQDGRWRPVQGFMVRPREQYRQNRAGRPGAADSRP